MSRQHRYNPKNRLSHDSSSSSSENEYSSDENETVYVIDLPKRYPNIKLGATSKALIEIIPSLCGRLCKDFDINTLRILDYPNSKTNCKFLAYLIHQGVVVSQGFNVAPETLHAEESIIGQFFKRNSKFRDCLTKNTAKWQRLLRSNIEERVQRQHEKVDSKVEVGYGIGFGLRQREVSCCP